MLNCSWFQILASNLVKPDPILDQFSMITIPYTRLNGLKTIPFPAAHTRIAKINLLLAECEVRTASYGPSFFLPFMAQARSARAMKTGKEKTRIHTLPYGLSKRG